MMSVLDAPCSALPDCGALVCGNESAYGDESACDGGPAYDDGSACRDGSVHGDDSDDAQVYDMPYATIYAVPDAYHDGKEVDELACDDVAAHETGYDAAQYDASASDASYHLNDH